jgi:hypothetical protein
MRTIMTDFNPFGGKVKWFAALVAIPAGMVSTFMAWDDLNLPRPAWSDEVAELEELHYDLRSTVLNDIYLRRKRELADVERQIWNMRNSNQKVPQWLVQEKATLEAQIKRIEIQLQDLRQRTSNGGGG